MTMVDDTSIPPVSGSIPLTRRRQAPRKSSQQPIPKRKKSSHKPGKKSGDYPHIDEFI
jgi:hypothetical protein